MGQLRSALSAALLAGATPSAALELLDRFASRLPGALASTAACVVLDPAAGTVRWARAGHLPPLLVTADGARLLAEPAGVVLGVPGRRAYTEGSAPLADGDTLLLYTDGLVERRGEDLDAGLTRLCELAGGLAGEDPERLATGLLHAMLAETDQPDDVALIAARVLPAPLRLTIPAEPRQLATLRRAVAAWSAAAGLGETTTEDLQLALGEAAANAVEHAYRDGPAGECAVTLDRTPGGGVAVRVTDTGTWRPEPADKGFRGRGLQLIEELGEDVEVRRVPGGTTVTFALRPGAPVRPAPSGPPADLPEGARLATGQDDGVLRLTLSGDLDLAGTEALGPALLGHLAAAAPGSRVELDLRPTTYLASSGVALLLRARAEAAGGGLELALLTRPDGLVARVLQLSGLAPVPAG
jgi:anti-anti-sigma factor